MLGAYPSSGGHMKRFCKEPLGTCPQFDGWISSPVVPGGQEVRRNEFALAADDAAGQGLHAPAPRRPAGGLKSERLA